jgi:hypothetical protein
LGTKAGGVLELEEQGNHRETRMDNCINVLRGKTNSMVLEKQFIGI